MPISQLQSPTRKVEPMTDQRPPSANRPSREFRNFVEEDLFRILLHLEVPKARRLQYSISVVCMTPDLRPAEVDSVLTKRIAEVATRQVRATDVVTTLSPSSIGLLLIDAETRTLPRIHKRLKEELGAHPSSAGGREWSSTWSAGGSCYPQTAASETDLLGQAMELMARAKEEGGDRLYLPS